MDIYRPQPQATAIGDRINMRAVMQQVYLWMTIGLITSAVVAGLFVTTGLTVALAPVLMIVMLVEVGLVWYLAARLTRISPERATTLFMVYAVLNGMTLSTIFYWANLSNIALALFATGAMFAAMSIIGYTTEIDLSRFRGILLMGLIGLIVASVVNIFVASSALYWLVTYAGVALFIGLTVYDTQWIKRQAEALEFQGVNSGAAAVRQVAIIGALKLYLDFVNLFLYILRIVNNR